VIAKLSRLVKRPASNWKLRKGRGCIKCGHTGYRGRIAVYEQFMLSDDIKQLVSSHAPLNVIMEASKKEGQPSLFESALNKTVDGVTTLDEAFSICAAQKEAL
jgi:type II secretory ATPase GspE/PulE/Tfp pilus assembly ATPase PilB-like protein